MKIMVIMGSPHQGESSAALDGFVDRMRGFGPVELDTLWLKDAHLEPCRGCHGCIRFNKCPLRDDLNAIVARIQAADGVIFVTPVYCMQVSYLMKSLFDRLAFLWHRPRFFGKFAMGLAAGGGQFGSTLGYIKENSVAWGMTWVTGVGAAHPTALVPRMRAKLDREMDQAARKFYTTVSANRVPAPGLMDLMRFRMWRINAQACRADNPTDFKHWTENGWFNRDYYTAQPVAPVKRLFARGMEGLIRRFLRGVYVGY